MSKPRITFGVCDDGQEVRIYVNPEGRLLLIQELAHLSEQSDHFHMHPEHEPNPEVPMRTIPYVPSEETIPYHVKVMLRPDDWDLEYFPHVMKDDDASA